MSSYTKVTPPPVKPTLSGLSFDSASVDDLMTTTWASPSATAAKLELSEEIRSRARDHREYVLAAEVGMLKDRINVLEKQLTELILYVKEMNP